MSYSVSVTRSGGGAVVVTRSDSGVKVVEANNVGTLVSVAQAAAASADEDAAAAAASALAASGSASAAASSATDAETAQTAAELAETHAETAETNAAASALAAAGSASSASTSAGTATTQAGIATTQAGLAAASAVAADASADAADASAIAAAASAASITLPLPIASGGTGQITAPLALAALGGIGASLLTTRGDIITRSASAPQRLALGATGRVLISDGTDAIYGTLTAGSFATGPGIVTPAMLDNGTALSVLGVAGNAGAARADIAFGSDGHVLRRSGTTVGAGTLAAGAFATGPGIISLAMLDNGTGNSVVARSASGSGARTNVQATVDGTVLRLSGTTLGFGTLAAGAFATGPGIVTPAMLNNGSARSVLGVTGNSAAARADMQATAYQVLRGNSAGTAVAFGAIDLSQSAAATGVIQAASFPAMTGDVTSVAGALATTIAADAVSNTKLANMAQSTIKGRAASAGTGDPTDLSVEQVKTILGLAPPTIQVITASGTYTPTTGATLAVVELVGGGGGGGGADVSTSSDWTASGGGGAGGYSRKLIALSGTYSVTIGAAGSAGNNTGGNGGTGGTTTFGTGPLLQATGGSGGTGSAAGGDPATLADLGLATNRDGTFRLDTARLTATQKAAPEGVAAMFTTGLFGVYASFDKLGRRLTAARRTRGRAAASAAPAM